MELNCNFLEGWGCKTKKPSMGGMDISRTAHFGFELGMDFLKGNHKST